MDSGQNHAAECLLIAPLENHATVGRVAALAGTSYGISVVDVSISDFRAPRTYPFDRLKRVYPLHASKTDPIYSATGRWRSVTLFVDWLRSYGLLPESRALSNRVRSAIHEVKPDVVVTFYGPIAIRYARIVKRIDPSLPVIGILNLIPSTIVTAKGRIGRYLRHAFGNEFADFRNWLHRLDGIVYASPEMQAFVERKFPAIRARTLIAPDYLPRTFQGSDDGRVSPASESARSVIFLGAPERYGGKLDSPDDQFVELAKAGIAVYSGQMTGEALRTPLCHVYPRLPNEDVFAGRLAEFARQFDAVLITYNISERHERFRSTFPTRFFTALTAGIPIAVRGGVFDACERFVAENQNGFVFSSVADLTATLTDRARMRRFRQRASELRKLLTAESQSDKLDEFLDGVAGASVLGFAASSKGLAKS